jgi:CheY-like chemotaxis protein
MPNKPDSITLFLEQIGNHSDELAALLAVGPREPVDPVVMERGLLCTTLLRTTASLMQLNSFQSMLEQYGQLLRIYRDRNLRWDERIAQLTSELIEREDRLVEEGKAGTPLEEAVTGEEWQALGLEAEEVIAGADEMAAEMSATPEPPPPPRAQPSPPRGSAAPSEAPKSAAPSEAPKSAAPSEAPDVLSRERAIGQSLDALQKHTTALVSHWNTSPWNPATLDQPTIADLRRSLLLTSFHAQSIEQILARSAGGEPPPRVETLAPIVDAIQDFTRVLSAGDERQLAVSFVGDHSLDSQLLSPIVQVLQRMISDTYVRCSDSQLNIQVVVQEQNGGLFWSLRDNGGSRVSDSHVDREEYLAFYPGLRDVRRILGQNHSLLWVEPSDNQDTRFSFSTPDASDGDSFVVWDNGTHAFAVLPSEVGDILTPEEAEVNNDARGEYMLQHGERVPLVRLGHLYEGAPSEGDLIVGYLEKRIAFYANGESSLRPGKWVRDAVTAWKGLKGFAQIEDRKLPLIEAEALLHRFLDIMSDTTEEGVAGGDIDEPVDLSQTQAMEKDAVSPPQHNDVAEGGAEVLIVERSEALRNTFAAILSKKQVRARLVGQVEDAIDCLTSTAPSLIISEFRAPSLAAKVLVEKLKAEGRDIPVLVTTTHQGEDAALLVQKLGAAGYISKPIDRGDVLDRVGSYIVAGSERSATPQG